MSTETTANVKRVTAATFIEMKREGKPIAMLTAYDYPTALYLDKAGIDGILVGDSVAMVELGCETTLEATMDIMVHHTKAVRRGVKRALLVADLPFMSYQISIETLENAGRFVREAEPTSERGRRGSRRPDRAIVDAGIPVMGHLETPRHSWFSGYGLQATTTEASEAAHRRTLLLQDLGCFSMSEKIPAQLAAFGQQEACDSCDRHRCGVSCTGRCSLLMTYLVCLSASS